MNEDNEAFVAMNAAKKLKEARTKVPRKKMSMTAKAVAELETICKQLDNIDKSDNEKDEPGQDDLLQDLKEQNAALSEERKAEREENRVFREEILSIFGQLASSFSQPKV